MQKHSFIPYGRQDISEEDVAAVSKVLQSDFLTQGPAVRAFEDAICTYTGAKYAVAVNSNTSGLHIACLALGLKPGGLLWTSPITFAASANCGRFCGADVDFVDIDPETFNLSILALEDKLQKARKGGRLPDIVVPVHLSGSSCDMAGLKALSDAYGFKILEDSAHAIGASYKGKKVGDCSYSSCSVYSLHPVKIITTGEGGVVTTNDKSLYDKLIKLRSHGITRDKNQLEETPHGRWYYEMQDLSHNYRMTDFQAALGTSQMTRLDDFVARRNVIARRYQKHFSGTPVHYQQIPDDCLASYHLFIVQVDAARKNAFFEKMWDANIGVNLHYIPVYLHPYYRRLGFKAGLCPNAESYYGQAMSIPLFPQMSDSDVDYVADTLLKQVRTSD